MGFVSTPLDILLQLWCPFCLDRALSKFTSETSTIFLHAYMCACMCTCMYVCMCMCMHACVHVCVYMCVYVHACACACVCTYTCACACVCLYVCIRTYSTWTIKNDFCDEFGESEPIFKSHEIRMSLEHFGCEGLSIGFGRRCRPHACMAATKGCH